MELSKVTIFLYSLLIPVLAWRDVNRRNERDMHFKQGYHDSTFNADEFHKQAGLQDDKKDDGGRGFFYFEKGGKKLVGYMDYGDDQKKSEGDPWMPSEKDSVKTYTFEPSSWKSDFDKKGDNVFAMAKPNTEQKMYFFSNNMKMSPQANRSPRNRQKGHQQPPRQQQSHQGSNGRSRTRDVGQMFDHGYSNRGGNDNFDDMDKRREEFHKEFNMVQVRNNNKWNQNEGRRQSKASPRFQMMRVVKPQRKERRSWKETMSRQTEEPRHQRTFYDNKKPAVRHARQPRRMSRKAIRMPMKKVHIVYESEDQKKQQQESEDYDGKVYVMLPSGQTKGKLGEWINSDFFTDTFIESFHPSSMDESARQGRMPVRRVVRIVPYHRNMYPLNAYKL